MLRLYLILTLLLSGLNTFSQKSSPENFLSDSSLVHASVSLYIVDSETEEVILDFNSGKSLTPASVMKLITSATALELLGPEYTFKTITGYTGTLNKKTGKLSGDIIIKGGGDPALGSPNFEDHYKDFISDWVTEIESLGIRKIEGGVITDDSYYDFQPVPAKWLWEDAGNYYGAGAYGLSVFDNTYGIRFSPGSDSLTIVKEIIPSENSVDLVNWLSAEGNTDNGYVFAAPYSNKGWMSGTIPTDLENFVLKASLSDPPYLIAKIVDKKLREAGISISEAPATFRLSQPKTIEEITKITETNSPTLSEIIEVLNHESVNLYAEHLVKELGKKYSNTGSTEAGVNVIKGFLQNIGVNIDGMNIEDGSGLSPVNSINSLGLVNLLSHMKKNGKYFSEFYSSLPEAGKEGTLKYYFRDPVFDSKLKAKSGSMTRVRSYAGYFTTNSGKQMIFSIIINNYTGLSRPIIAGIEDIIKEIIINK